MGLWSVYSLRPAFCTQHNFLESHPILLIHDSQLLFIPEWSSTVVGVEPSHPAVYSIKGICVFKFCLLWITPPSVFACTGYKVPCWVLRFFKWFLLLCNLSFHLLTRLPRRANIFNSSGVRFHIFLFINRALGPSWLSCCSVLQTPQPTASWERKDLLQLTGYSLSLRGARAGTWSGSRGGAPLPGWLCWLSYAA